MGIELRLGLVKKKRSSCLRGELTVKSNAKHDENKDGKNESIARHPLEESVVCRITFGDFLEDETDNA